MTISSLTFESAGMLVLAAAASLYLLWLFYLAVMALDRAYKQGTLSKPALILGTPILLVGLAINLFLNVTLGSIIFLDVPQEYTLSERLARLSVEYPNAWRGKLAVWVCSNILDTFDPSGDHC